MLSSSGLASASCIAPPGLGLGGTSLLDGASVVFVGTVLSTSNGDRVARVRVESVWKGGPVPVVVTVSGTPDPGSAATSVDRTFAPGRRYLFLPSNTTSPYQDSSCSATQPYAPVLDSLRPPGAQAPTGTDGLDQTTASWWVWALGAAGIAIGVGLVAWIGFRRRRGRD